MIIFSAITPHSPLLLPTIGKDNRGKLKKTLAAYKTLEEELYAARPDTIVVISPHGTVLPDAFSLFIAPHYVTNLKEFGDLTTTLKVKSDMRTIESLRRLQKTHSHVPLTGNTDEFLDYGTTVPLSFLLPRLVVASVVPLGISGLPLAAHEEIGRHIGDVLQQSKRRIAVVASADLAHTLTDAAPGGFSLEGKKFDQAVVHAFRKDDRAKILKLEPMAERVKSCGLRPIAMLFGILDDINCTPTILSYEGPFGVGHLVVRFNFK